MTRKIHIARPRLDDRIKLAIAAPSAAAVPLAELLAGFKLHKPKTRCLKATYYDTPTHDLHANRISLRVSKTGRSRRQHVKIEIVDKDGTSPPLEVEHKLSGSEPDLQAIPSPQVRKRVRNAIGEASLNAIFATEIHRTLHLATDDSDNQVEITLDDVTIKVGRKEHHFADLHLAQRIGRSQALADIIAELITKGAPLAPERQSDDELGYHLLLKRADTALEPAKMISGGIAASDTCVDSFRILCAPMTRQILHNWSVVLEATHPEGPHQLRVAVRQLRTVLRAFRPIMRRKAARTLEQDLKELGRIVGAVRDLDVLGADIVGAVPITPDLQPALCAVVRAVAKHRDTERDNMRQALAHPRMQALRLQLALLPTELGWRLLQRGKVPPPQSIQSIAMRALKKSWRRSLTLGERIESLSIAERHELRKRLKSLRYTLDAFRPLYPRKATAQFVRDLKQLQKIFGYLNDATLAERLYDIEPTTRDAATFQRTIGYIAGYHAANSALTWEQAKRSWSELATAKQPWS